MGESTETKLAVMDLSLRTSNKRLGKVEETVSKMDDKLDTVLQFMAAQEEKNSAAEKEREQIFKASTLLPVALLTSVISVSVNYMFNSKPAPTTPDNGAYILPARSGDHKQVALLGLKRKDED